MKARRSPVTTRVPLPGKPDMKKLVKLLRREYPDPVTALHYRDPFHLLISVILSAQCTDVRVNLVTADLFRKYRKPQDYLDVMQEELENDIRPTGFFRNKARNIQACCRVLVKQYGGKVPSSMEELVGLPGVGRKTANCVLGEAFGIPAGIVVDTHVIRVSNRLGLTKHRDAVKIERDLMTHVPKDEWIHFGNRIIHHGREVCGARKPNCPACVLNGLCPSAEL